MKLWGMFLHSHWSHSSSLIGLAGGGWFYHMLLPSSACWSSAELRFDVFPLMSFENFDKELDLNLSSMLINENNRACIAGDTQLVVLASLAHL